MTKDTAFTGTHSFSVHADTKVCHVVLTRAALLSVQENVCRRKSLESKYRWINIHKCMFTQCYNFYVLIQQVWLWYLRPFFDRHQLTYTNLGVSDNITAQSNHFQRQTCSCLSLGLDINDSRSGLPWSVSGIWNRWYSLVLRGTVPHDRALCSV